MNKCGLAVGAMRPRWHNSCPSDVERSDARDRRRICRCAHATMIFDMRTRLRHDRVPRAVGALSYYCSKACSSSPEQYRNCVDTRVVDGRGISLLICINPSERASRCFSTNGWNRCSCTHYLDAIQVEIAVQPSRHLNNLNKSDDKQIIKEF